MRQVQNLNEVRQGDTITIVRNGIDNVAHYLYQRPWQVLIAREHVIRIQGMRLDGNGTIRKTAIITNNMLRYANVYVND